ncbi:hypothetical protein ACIQI8_27415 [Streptomyces sp. NPDC092369]|uniref:hypothetical protein n=1 Tax=Streptomyces sp. NPDC092369 TaxID=3366015 RepID=UPI0037F2DA6C
MRTFEGGVTAAADYLEQHIPGAAAQWFTAELRGNPIPHPPGSTGTFEDGVQAAADFVEHRHPSEEATQLGAKLRGMLESHPPGSCKLCYPLCGTHHLPMIDGICFTCATEQNSPPWERT